MKPRMHVWAERSDDTAPWVWHYGPDDETGRHVHAGECPLWRDAVSAAEWLLYAQHHAVPVGVVP